MTGYRNRGTRVFAVWTVAFALLAFSASAGDVGRKGSGQKGQKSGQGKGQGPGGKGAKGSGQGKGQGRPQGPGQVVSGAPGFGQKGPGATGAVLQGAPTSGAPGLIQFTASKGPQTHIGRFQSWRFTKIDLPNGNIEQGTVEIEVDMASVQTSPTRLNDHLKRNDILDVQSFVKSAIKIFGAKPSPGGGYDAQATLTLKGLSKTLPVKFKVVSQDPLVIEGEAVLLRSDFKVYPPYEGGQSPTNEVKIVLKTPVPWRMFAGAGGAPGAKTGAGAAPPAPVSAAVANADKYLEAAGKQWGEGNMAAAITMAKQALTIYKEELGEEHAKVAEVQAMIDTAGEQK